MKVKIIFFIVLALLVFSGASPWEGAAAIAPDGELPATGRYVATNSFPRNTVVDIVNIETNRSTRAIVANGLDSPGLLAVVSREAAEMIGMRSGSVSRIRMTQPSDPIAYLRFTEGLAAGVPEYDSGNVITEENYREELEKIEQPANIATGRDNLPPNRETPPQTPENAFSGTPGYVLEPEWGGRNPRDIVDLEYPYTAYSGEPETEQIAANTPEEVDEPVEQVAEYTPEEEVDEPAEQIAEYTPEEEVDEPAEQIAEYTPEEEIDEPAEQIAEYTPEEEIDEPAEQVAEYTPEEEIDEPAEQVAEYTPEEKIDEPAKQFDLVPKYVAEVPQYNIKPSQERPPSGTIYGIDPADIIPGISRTIPEKEPVRESAAVAPAEPIFSAPRIYELDRGWYYVQIAAMDTAESAENAITMIDRSYKPVVYKDGDKWYRILLGPLNQGESAAVLQRFRSIGYKDAFVRQNK